VALRADLRGELVFLPEVVGAEQSGFFDADAQRLFHVAVQVAVQRPIADERVRMVRRAAEHRVEALVIEALAPVDVGLGLGEPLGAVREVLLVHVAESHDVLAGDGVEMGVGPAPGADHGDVELVAWCVGSGEHAAGQDGQPGPKGGAGFEELTSLHGDILLSPGAGLPARRDAPAV